MKDNNPMFIKLTIDNGKSGFLNMALCTGICRSDEPGVTSVFFDNENEYQVRETPEQIIEMLKEHVAKEQQLKAIAKLQHNLVEMGAQ